MEAKNVSACYKKNFNLTVVRTWFVLMYSACMVNVSCVGNDVAEFEDETENKSYHIEDTIETQQEINILVIGNSVSRDAFSYVPALFKELCPMKSLNIEILYIGGVALSAHWESICAKYPIFTLDSYFSENSRWEIKENVRADDVLSKKRDLVILQEGSVTSRAYKETQANIKHISEYIRSIHPDLRVAYMLNPSNPEGSESLGKLTSDEVWRMISLTAKQLLNNQCVNYVIPCGTAIQNARRTYMAELGDFGNLSYEGRHLQEGLPCLIEAYTATHTLFKIFGLDASVSDSNLKITQPWIALQNIPGQHGKVVEGSEDDYALCKTCAQLAVEIPYEISIISACGNFPKVFQYGQFNLEAHRGFSDEYPENTLLAFDEAGKTGMFQGIETDVQMTKDDVLVCVHDDTLDRIAGVSGKVSDYTYGQLQSFFIIGGNGWNPIYEGKCHIPTFREYLGACKKYGLIPYIELKNLPNRGISNIIKILHEEGYKDGTFVLTSFTLEKLEYANTLCETPLEWIKSSFSDEEIKKISVYRNFLVRADAGNVSESFVKKCQDWNVAVECWDIKVGDKSRYNQLKAWGVKGGTCNSWKYLK